VLVAQAVFLLERGHKHIHTVAGATDYPTHASANADMGNKAIVDSRLHPGAQFTMNTCWAVLSVGISAVMLVTFYPAYEYTWRAMRPLHGNITSSTKPEVHNGSQRRQRRTEPRTPTTCSKIWWSSAVRFSSYANGQTDRQTDRQTNKRTVWNRHRPTHHNTSHPS